MSVSGTAAIEQLSQALTTGTTAVCPLPHTLSPSPTSLNALEVTHAVRPLLSAEKVKETATATMTAWVSWCAGLMVVIELLIQALIPRMTVAYSP